MSKRTSLTSRRPSRRLRFLPAILASSAIAAPALAQSFSGDGTFYDPSVGVGACGFEVPGADAYVAALNPDQFAEGAACGRCIEVHGPDGSVVVRVIDLCPSCASGSVDLGQGPFREIADPDQGRVPITWDFVDCAGR
ncbi:expansin EXLX1 family cellulose-binding protein [Sorangium atrum]|uniref:Expansin EXLX1 family cellulose-binding protein n=1 Tax=Sorangium atrum TaxID=2995308 RepID=A0ABT5CEN4_9BACT|nr:expansin EXLX1 family cellulose-binding protein [Sorangium aterium]MDC0684408.1 expansin EXLX1 family cellulose-binding protein [Sorangium aterium]